jgi:hypothetical protein
MPEILPNLRMLSYDETDFCFDLLAARPIERLCVPGKGIWRLHAGILASPGRLSHLFVTQILALLRFALSTTPEPYLHLRHIGTVTFEKSEVDCFLLR